MSASITVYIDPDAHYDVSECGGYGGVFLDAYTTFHADGLAEAESVRRLAAALVELADSIEAHEARRSA